MTKKRAALESSLTLIDPLYTAFVVQTFWNWFIVPSLRAEAISYWPALGLVILAGVLTARGTDRLEAVMAKQDALSGSAQLRSSARACRIGIVRSWAPRWICYRTLHRALHSPAASFGQQSRSQSAESSTWSP